MTRAPVRVVLFADGPVGLAITTYLLQEFPHDVVLIATCGDQAISRIATDHSIPVCDSTSEADLRERVVEASADIGVLAWWPSIIKEPILSSVPRGFVNTHPSLLPHNRGKNYNFWAILEGVPFGVSIHEVIPAVDAGDILAQREIPYDWTDTGETLYRRAQEEMVALFKEAYPDIRSGNSTRIPQDLEKGSFHLARELEQASQVDLDRTYTARELLNLLRARTFLGYPGASFVENGERFEVSVSIRRSS